MDVTIIFGIGFVASFFGSFMSGGVSIIGLSLLGLYGLPVLSALGIYRVGVVGFQTGGFITYARSGKVVWKKILPFILLGLPASYIGANLVLQVNEEVLSKIVGFALLCFIPIGLLVPHFGVAQKQTSKKRTMLGYCLYFCTSVWGSSFVIGTGILNMFNQIYSFGMTLLEVKGTAKIPALLKGLVVLLVFSYAEVIDWELGLVFLAGMFIGSFLGAKYTLKIGDTWLKYILLVTVALVSVKLILGW